MDVVVLYGSLILFMLVGFLIIRFEARKGGIVLFKSDFYQVLLVLFWIGLFVRYYNLGQLPGLQIDEAMSGYDTWALANYGQDSALNSWPIYLIGYGTGPSALYSYLSLPFVKVLGLTVISTRLAMVYLSSATLLFTMWTLIRLKISRQLVMSIFFIFIINPWQIMISRFGLDANVAPHLLLITFCLLQLGLESQGKKQNCLYSGAMVSLGLTAYAYIATWYFLPVFSILLLFYFWKNKLLRLRQTIGLSLILVVTIAPVILFAYIQYFGEGSISILGITFPKLLGSQNEGQTILYSNDIWSAFLMNLNRIHGFLLSGRDGLIFSSLPNYGMIYNLAGLLLFCVGIVKVVREKSHLSSILFAWLIAPIPLILIVIPVVHHWNVFLFPVILVMGYGVSALWSLDKKSVSTAIFGCFTVLFVSFLFSYNSSYRNEQQDSTYMAPQTMNDVIQISKEKKLGTVYVDRTSIHQLNELAFIFFRFFDPVSPEAYQASRDQPFDRETNMTSDHYARYTFMKKSEFIEDNKGQIGYLYHQGLNLSDYEEKFKGFEVYQNKDFILFYKE